MSKKDTIAVPRWFLDSVENTLRIQNNINQPDMKKTGESCQDRNIRQALNGIRKLLSGEELTGMERLERLKPFLPKNLDGAAEAHLVDVHDSVLNSEAQTIEDFKSGAFWLAEQGASYEETISADKTISVLPMKDVSGMGFAYGDKVIVQIRKK